MATSLRDAPPEAKSLPYPRLSLVLNEKAGALLAAGETPDLAAQLNAAGATTRTIPPGGLPDRLRDAMQDADAVIVAGGDGTVACAAAALGGSGMPLGILPAGTMNLLARDLALPTADLTGAARIILDGHTAAIDVGTAGGHVFLCACMLGDPARLGHHRETARRHGAWSQWPKFARALAKVLFRPRSLRVTLTVDGRPHRLKTRSLTITVNALEDGQGRLFARPRLDGGRLVAYILQRRRMLDVLRVFVRIALGRPKDAALLVLDGTEMTIHSTTPALHVLIDGEERLLKTPLTFGIRPGNLLVLVPAPATADAP